MATATLNHLSVQDSDLAHSDLELDLGDGANHWGTRGLCILSAFAVWSCCIRVCERGCCRLDFCVHSVFILTKFSASALWLFVDVFLYLSRNWLIRQTSDILRPMLVRKRALNCENSKIINLFLVVYAIVLSTSWLLRPLLKPAPSLNCCQMCLVNTEHFYFHMFGSSNIQKPMKIGSNLYIFILRL